MDDSIPTDLLVQSCIRQAASEGVSIMVRQKGDPTSGVILLKLNLLDRTAQLYTQIRVDGRLAWSPKDSSGPISEDEVEAMIKDEMAFDPDLWLIEIEDRKGRLWFPGKVIQDYVF